MRGAQPLVLGLKGVHSSVELPQVLVPQKMIVDQVELPASVRKRVAVALPREIHPPDWHWLGACHNVNSLRVPELVALEVEVGFSSERVNQESDGQARTLLCDLPDHFVQGDSPINDWRQGTEIGHVIV